MSKHLLRVNKLYPIRTRPEVNERKSKTAMWQGTNVALDLFCQVQRLILHLSYTNVFV